MAKKNILMITTSPFYGEKGSTLRIQSIAKILSQEYYVDLVSYKNKVLDSTFNKINIFEIGKNNFLNQDVGKISIKKIYLDWLVLKKTLSLLKTKRYDVIHCEDFEAAAIGLFIKFFYSSLTFVYDLHNRIKDNLEINNYKNNFLLYVISFVEKLIINKFNFFILNWPMYQQEEPFINKKTILFQDQTDTTNKKIIISIDKPYLAYSGNFKKYQGIENFINIYNQKVRKFALVLIGKADKKLIKKYKDNKNIKFFDILSLKESNYVLSKSLACLSPRISGKQPGLKIIHHLLLNKVTIASDLSANKVILDENTNIFYKNEQDLEKIFEAIENRKIDFSTLEKKIAIEREKFLKQNSSHNFLKSYQRYLNK
ncbi:MAG: glycosyltransferase [Candidatus Pacebacteria bacterium]|nr:glycosyltransferase [Candidatus Paceibacterota bacterium]